MMIAKIMSLIAYAVVFGAPVAVAALFQSAPEKSSTITVVITLLASAITGLVAYFFQELQKDLRALKETTDMHNAILFCMLSGKNIPDDFMRVLHESFLKRK